MGGVAFDLVLGAERHRPVGRRAVRRLRHGREGDAESRPSTPQLTALSCVPVNRLAVFSLVLGLVVGVGEGELEDLVARAEVIDVAKLTGSKIKFGATVLLVPLAINIAIAKQADPAVFAMIVALATSNSFLIPTHQVNALIMGPAGYRVADFLRAGGVMTLLFVVVMLVMVNLVF